MGFRASIVGERMSQQRATPTHGFAMWFKTKKVLPSIEHAPLKKGGKRTKILALASRVFP